MKKSNILFISHAADVGGAEKCLLELVCHLDRDKYNIYVNIPYKGPLASKLDISETHYFVAFTDQWIPSRVRWGIKHAFNFLKKLRARIWAIETKIHTLNIDLVYSNSITCIDGAIAAYRMGVPHIWHLHENLQGNKGLRSYLPHPVIRYIVNKLSNHFIAVSNTVARIVSKKPAGKTVAIIHNGVDLNKYAIGNKSTLQTELGLNQGVCIIACIGSVIPAKGITTFIRSAVNLAGRYHNKRDIAFVLVGDSDPNYIDEIVKEIDQSTYRSGFYLLGQRNDIPEIMNSIDILVLASESEGLSRVVMEAMAAGKPVVSTRCGGPEEIIIDGETGFLVPIGDIEKLSGKLRYLIDNPEQALAMGEQGRKHVAEHFSMEQCVRSIEYVIDNAIARE